MVRLAARILLYVRGLSGLDVGFELRECGARLVAADVIYGRRVDRKENGRADREPDARIHGFEEE